MWGVGLLSVSTSGCRGGGVGCVGEGVGCVGEGVGCVGRGGRGVCGERV